MLPADMAVECTTAGIYHVYLNFSEFSKFLPTYI